MIYVKDTPGQEEYSKFLEFVYEKGDAFIVGFSVTDRGSLFDCDNHLKTILKEPRERKPAIVALGNKIDLEELRQISTEEARSHFGSFNPPIPYFESSALKGIGVNAVFEHVINLWEENHSSTLNENSEPKNEDRCIIA